MFETSYKKDIDDTRESPSVELIKLLEDRGANVDYSDPFVVEFPKCVSTNMNSVVLILTLPI